MNVAFPDARWGNLVPYLSSQLRFLRVDYAESTNLMMKWWSLTIMAKVFTFVVYFVDFIVPLYYPLIKWWVCWYCKNNVLELTYDHDTLNAGLTIVPGWQNVWSRSITRVQLIIRLTFEKTSLIKKLTQLENWTFTSW